MIDKINELLRRVEEFKPKAAAEIEDFRIRVLGKKGELNALMEEFKTVAPELKRELGQQLNRLKQEATKRINALREELQNAAADRPAATDDLTRPGTAERLGSRHPIALVRNEIVEVFSRLGYTVADGPEIEDDWHVFSALNFPPEHPARDMQDTFFIEKDPDILLRTHTSSIQVRTMERQRPPIRVICPGRVFRNEAISYRAHCIFHQIEGLYIDEGVSFADMKQSLEYFAKEIFGEQTAIRMRPSYFPFTEPSAEVDVSCNLCGGKGCAVCKGTGWLEIMGCGMVDPNVLTANNIDPGKYSGFAFGIYDSLGLELVMDSLPDPRRAGHDLGIYALANSAGLALAAIIGALLVNAFEHSFGYYLLFPSAIVMVLLAGIVTLTTKSAE